MSLIDRLRGLGAVLGLVQMHAAPRPGAPAKITTRVVRLADLVAGIRGDRVEALAQGQDDAQADLAVPFAAIDEAAGVQAPAHGWTIERLAARLARPDLAQAPREQVQAVVLAELAAAGAPAEDVVRDAVARDRAVDAFAASVHASLTTRIAQRGRSRAELAARLAALQQEAAALDALDRADRERWLAWWALKLERERAMARALACLLEQPAVSVDEQPPAIGC